MVEPALWGRRRLVPPLSYQGVRANRKGRSVCEPGRPSSVPHKGKARYNPKGKPDRSAGRSRRDEWYLNAGGAKACGPTGMRVGADDLKRVISGERKTRSQTEEIPGAGRRQQRSYGGT